MPSSQLSFGIPKVLHTYVSCSPDDLSFTPPIPHQVAKVEVWKPHVPKMEDT